MELAPWVPYGNEKIATFVSKAIDIGRRRYLKLTEVAPDGAGISS